MSTPDDQPIRPLGGTRRERLHLRRRLTSLGAKRRQGNLRVRPVVLAGMEMVKLDTMVTWVDARDRLPRSGTPVAAAITGRYPPDRDVEDDADDPLGEEFWLVRPMYFTSLHFGADEAEHTDCFVDSDGVVRLPYGLGSAETVTHWAELPTLPGEMTTRAVLGEGVQAALRRAWSAEPRS